MFFKALVHTIFLGPIVAVAAFLIWALGWWLGSVQILAIVLWFGAGWFLTWIFGLGEGESEYDSRYNAWQQPLARRRPRSRHRS